MEIAPSPAPAEPAASGRPAGKFELPWLVLAALLLSTVIGGWQAARQQSAEAVQRFAELAAAERDALARRIEAIRVVASGAAGFAVLEPTHAPSAWREFLAGQNLRAATLPGLVALRRAHPVALPTAKAPPAGPLPEYRFASPADEPADWHAFAEGDAASTAQATLSPPLAGQAGRAYYVMRIQHAGQADGTDVFALVDVAALLKGRADVERVLAVTWADAGTTVTPAAAPAGAVSRRTVQALRVLDRDVTLGIESTPALEQRLSSQTPRLVLLVGLVSCVLLAGLIWLLTRLRSQAESLAQSMTRQLSEQKRFTEGLIEHNPNPIFRKDASGRFVSVNRAWEELTGHQRGEVLGKRYADLMPGPLAEANEAHDNALFNSPEGRSVIETQLQGAQGQVFQTIVAKQLLTGADGRPEGLIGTITDVTQLKALEREVEAQREQQSLVIRASQQGVWDSGSGPEATPFFSERFQEILGFQPGEFPVPFDWRDILHPEDAAHFKAEMVRLFKRLSPLFDVEVRVRRQQGDYVWVRARGIAQYGADGRAVRFTGSITDVSDRKKAELELTEANVRVLDAARAKEAFLATMSHEMRTPLNGVLGMTSLLADTSLDDEQRDHIRLIRASGDTLLRIIDDILDFSKIESGRMMLESVPVELVPLVEEAFELVAERARDKRLALIFDLADNVPFYVLGDTTRLRQILLNLLANAIKFTERGHIALSITCRSTMDSRLRLEFAIADTGIGIPANRIDTLFQPFTQVDASTTRKYGGTGLGLAICKRLVNLMGGDIRVDSVEGKGSLFLFHIITEPAKGPARGYMQRNVPELAGKRLLVVDANPLRRDTQVRRYKLWGLDAAGADPAGAAALLHEDGGIDIVIAEAALAPAEARGLAQAVEDNDALRSATAREPAIVILASTLARADFAAEPPAMLPRHDMFVVRPAGRMRMFDLLSRAALGQRQGDFAARPFTPDPVRDAVQAPEQGLRLPAAGKPADAAALRLLVAEDNEVNQRVIIGMLNNLGHRPHLVADGQAAVEAAAQGTFDAILLDVQMPVMDGIEAMRRIRAASTATGRTCPPMIAMTAHALPGDREQCIAAGMDDYLSKPIRVSALSAALAKVGMPASGAAAETSAANVKPPLPPVLDIEQLNDLRGLPALPGEAAADDGAGGLIDLFRAQTIERLDIMSAKRQVEDWAGLAETAHSLRGAAASIGFPRVAAVCKDVEANARTLAGNPGKMQRVPDANPTRVSELLVDLQSRVIEANVALDEWLSTAPPLGQQTP
ncbi:MAG: PAS domain S-box protein [Betaproteobacteria bacterium]|nr:PAS domain S-box protein [Betaproteobacteria bacterium]